MWDLYDGKGGAAEPYDLVDGRIAGITNAVFQYIAIGPPAQARQHSGADLVNFLDGYRGQHYAAGTGFGDETELRTLVAHHQFPYDYPAALTCR